MNRLARAALVTVVVWVVAASAAAQGRTVSNVTVLSLDVIGPRTTASVRAALRRHHGELDACRGDADALVRVGLAIAPDGSVLRPTPVDDPDLDADVTGCVIGIVSGWRFPARTGSVTTVVWSFRLRGTAVAEPAPVGRRCWCFDWVHGPDHGLDCAATRALCDRGRRDRGSSGDSTECRSLVQPTCGRDGYVDGQHMHQP